MVFTLPLSPRILRVTAIEFAVVSQEPPTPEASTTYAGVRHPRVVAAGTS